MKILCYSDCHWSVYSSIIRSRGEKYSTRLENLIESVNWAERCAEQEGCEKIICLGDFFDKAELDAEAVTALTEIKWARIPHVFLVGNHEMNRRESLFSTAHLLNLHDDIIVADRPYAVYLVEQDIELAFLPYTLDYNIPERFRDANRRTRILFSHNDVCGINYGQFVSKEGFQIEDIEDCCDLCINGHIHNNGKISTKIINIGNITGQNFSEDASKYEHDALIIDTDNLSVQILENPYAFNFYKLDFTKNSSIDYINSIALKSNAIVAVRCFDDDAYECIRTRFDPSHKNSLFPKHCNVILSKFLVERKILDNNIDDVAALNFSVDHLSQFKDFVLNTIGTDDITLQELQEVCK